VARPPTTYHAPGGPHPLASLADAIASDGAAWRDWFELEAPEAAPPPGVLGASLTPFERLLPLRCLRVDRVTVGVTRWVIGELGERYVTPPVSQSTYPCGGYGCAPAASRSLTAVQYGREGSTSAPASAQA
jgi:hypothetical protein